MEKIKSIAKYRYARSSAQKVRLVADLIRGKRVVQSIEVLNFTKKKTSNIIKKVLESAVSNIRNFGIINIDDLIIEKIFVDSGPTMKRIMMRAKGRSNRILKRTSHITIVISN